MEAELHHPRPRRQTPLRHLLVVLLLLVPAAAAAAAVALPPIPGLDTFLADQFRRDPTGTNDTLPLLPTSLRSPLSAHLPHPLRSPSPLLSFPLHLHLAGHSFPPDAPSLLSSFLSAAVFPARFHLIAGASAGGLSHDLAVRHQPNIVADSAPPSLAADVAAAVRSHLDASPGALRSPLHAVPYSAVDDVVRRDFALHHAAAPGFHVYLLDSADPENPSTKRHAYFYSGAGAGESSPAVTRCLGTVFAGSDRYVWIDLAAGPVDYGPALSGDGLLPRGEFHPLAALHGRPKSNKAFVADLASLVWSAYQVLLVPSLRIPVTYEDVFLVEFVHVYGSDNKDHRGLDWGLIKETFTKEVDRGELSLKGQSLRFKNYEARYSDCPICSFAISRATNSYTSRFLFTNYTLIVSEYLDSKRLHQILSDSSEELKRSIGIEEEDYGRVIPVYVFDLDYDKLLLLDRYHQAVAFKDMVIVVRTRSSQTVSDYSCNGRHVITQTRDLERPIVGAILQSMWGVSPTHLTWSSQHNSTLVDYTWSIGQTPFGPFSEMTSLSFVQKDAARRNLILTSLNYTIASAIDALDSMTAYGGDRKLLKRNRHVEFVERWNLLNYKLDKAASSLSHLDYELALFYLRSSDHDLFAIHSLVYQASQELEASLSCFKDPPFPWDTMLLLVGMLLASLYVYAKRDRLFRNKRKQF